MIHDGHAHMQDIGKVLGIPVVNGVVLAVSFLTELKDFLQVVLILGTISFTFLQLKILAKRLTREKKLMELVVEAQAACPKASSGQCPVAQKAAAVENI